MELTQEQMFRAYDEAPEVVRRALQPEGLAMLFVEEIADRYKLHVDVAGTISILIRNMILGFLSPSAFSMELEKAGVTEGTARQLLIDLNTQVFVPLRNQVRQGTESYPSQPPQVPAMKLTKPSSAPAVIPQAPPPPSPTPSYNLIQPKSKASVSSPEPARVVSPSVPVPTMRTMRHDMELVQQGSMPAPYPMPHPQQSTPARMFQTASVPVTAMPPPPREVVHIVPDASVGTAKSIPQIAPVGDYTLDPYREPI